MTPDLPAYFRRIGYQGSREPTLATLRAVHRAHVCRIAYENIDVVARTPVDQTIERIFAKIVGAGRGGWCYEMNGLLGWALTTMGFEVTRMVGGVERSLRGDSAFGNHLVLRVAHEGAHWIVDAGLGDGLLDPIPLAEGDVSQGWRRASLRKLSEGEWRFTNREHGLPPDFDFRTAPADEALLQATCEHLQTDPESRFVQNLIVQRVSPDGGQSLIGRLLIDMRTGQRTLLDSAAHLERVLRDDFELTPPDMAPLWPGIAARHDTLFGAEGSA